MIKPIVAGILFFLISIILAILIFFFGVQAGFTTLSDKTILWFSLTVVVVALLLLFPVTIRALWANWASQLSRQQLIKPNRVANPNIDSIRLVNTTYRWEQLKQFYQLTTQYKDHQKPWILVMGSDAVLEQAFPGIKENLWVESHQAFWLDAQGIDPVGGWHTLRGHNKRPAEGIICLSNKQHQTYHFGEQLQTLFAKLGWLLPINRIYINQTENGQENSVVSHVLNHKDSKDKIQTGLATFVQELKVLGTMAIERKIDHRFIANLSQALEAEFVPLAEAIVADKKILGKLDSIEFISFIEANDSECIPSLIFKSFDTLHIFNTGKKLKLSQSDYIYWGLSALTLSLIGVFAYTANYSQHKMLQFQSNLVQLRDASVIKNADKIEKLVALQNEIINMEKAATRGRDYLTRIVGYDHSNLLLNKAYKQYGQSAQELILQPTIHQLTNRLNQLNSLSAQELAALSDEGTQYYNVLKTYLMLTKHTDKIESKFLTEQMLLTLKQQGVKFSQANLTAAFFVQQFAKHKNWADEVDAVLVENSRQSLAVWMGEHHTEERVYNRIINAAKEKYPAVTLAQLLNRDIRGIWNVGKPLPGIYTIRSWEEYIKLEFAKAAKNNHSDDWVLASSVQAQQEPVNETLITGLKERYFKEYAEAWFNVLNSITWVPRTKSLDTINQLQAYADPQRSPLIGLFNIIKANGTLEGKQVVLNPKIVTHASKLAATQISNRGHQADNIVLKNQNDSTIEIREQAPEHIEGPLQRRFETLLQLVDVNIAHRSDLSLHRYLEKVTSTKQRLIQISSASDAGAASRIAMQNAINNEKNEFTEGLQYARLIEANIGGDWLPFSYNVFVLPFYTAWDSITGSAKNSVNTMWNQNLSMPLQMDLGGRYPFSSSEAEISLSMLAKYLEPEQGLIDQFIKTQLGGVVTKQGGQWIENPGQNLRVNKTFLNQVNKISAVSNEFFANGEGSYTFELKPAPTLGITQFNLSVDGQNIEYFNQEAEWKSFKWPGNMANAGVRVMWETDESGLRQTQEYGGRLGFIRMLEAARVTPIDRSTYLIELPLVKEKSLRFYMRTNAGRGPLALLDLRNIQIPTQIFDLR